jgi:hypothetical protein
MTKTPQLTLITDVTIDIETNGGVDRLALIDLETINAGTRFRVRTLTPLDGYLYLVILDQQSSVVDVVYPASGTRQVTAGEGLTVPSDGSWLTANATGPLRVVIANQPVAPGEWPNLGHGRDGDAHTTTGNQGHMTTTTDGVQSTPPPPSKDAKAPPANQPKQQNAGK